MEKEIRQTVLFLKRCYYAFLLLTILLIIFVGIADSYAGSLATDAKAIYIAETLIILVTIIFVPLSLKCYAWFLANKINHMSIAHALKAYRSINLFRLLLLAIPTFVGFAIYYTMMSSTGALCAMIAFTASLFCLPSQKRVYQELYIDINESENRDEE